MQSAKGTDLWSSGVLKKLAATYRKVSHHVTVAWHKGKVFTKIRTQENCGLWKELVAAGRKIICCAKVARRKGYELQGRSHE
jgi:hypothetical protein